MLVLLLVMQASMCSLPSRYCYLTALIMPLLMQPLLERKRAAVPHLSVNASHSIHSHGCTHLLRRLC